MTSFIRGVSLWFQHALFYSALVLTVWIPGNILIELIKIFFGDGLTFAMEFRIPMIVNGFISPILAGAVLHSTDALAAERSIRFGEAIRFGLGIWGRLFATRFVANLITILGLLCLVIPGVVIAIRFAFLTQSVVLGGKGGDAARRRSWELVPRVWWKVVVCGLLFLAGSILGSAILYGIWEAVLLMQGSNLPLWTYHAAEVFIGCGIDIMVAPLSVVMYFLYKEAAHEWVGPAGSTLIDEGNTMSRAPLDLGTEDKNPYRPPVTE